MRKKRRKKRRKKMRRMRGENEGDCDNRAGNDRAGASRASLGGVARLIGRGAEASAFIWLFPEWRLWTAIIGDGWDDGRQGGQEMLG